MQVTLDADGQKFVEEKLKAGQFERAEDVIVAALSALRNSEWTSDFAPGELNKLLEEGERSGRNEKTYTLDEVVATFKAKSAARREAVARPARRRKTA